MGNGRHYLFGPFTLIAARRELLDGAAPVALGGRALDLLVAMVEGRDRVMLKDELMHRVWPDTVVEENNLTVNVSALRKALREGAGEQRYIRTVPGPRWPPRRPHPPRRPPCPTAPQSRC